MFYVCDTYDTLVILCSLMFLHWIRWHTNKDGQNTYKEREEENAYTETEIFLRFKIIYFLLFIELYTLTLVCLIRKIFAGAILITKITFLLLIYFVKSRLRMKTRYLHFSCNFFFVCASSPFNWVLIVVRSNFCNSFFF